MNFSIVIMLKRSYPESVAFPTEKKTNAAEAAALHSLSVASDTESVARDTKAVAFATMTVALEIMSVALEIMSVAFPTETVACDTEAVAFPTETVACDTEAVAFHTMTVARDTVSETNVLKSESSFSENKGKHPLYLYNPNLLKTKNYEKEILFAA